MCLVTDRKRCGGRPLEQVVSLALLGGVNAVQLREKDLPSGELLEIAARLRGLTAGRALLIVNDRADVALASGADGVQLSEDALSVAAVRDVCGDRLLIGRSVHDVDGAVTDAEAGADFLVAGNIFATASHPGRPGAGVHLLDRLRSQIDIPYLAIGGVNAGNVVDVIRAGAAGAAVITALSESDDPERAATELVAATKRAFAQSRSAAMERTA